MLKTLGGILWMVFRFLVIIALCGVGVYCIFSILFFPFLWEGVIRLLIGLACGAAAFAVIRLGREKDNGPAEKINDLW